MVQYKRMLAVASFLVSCFSMQAQELLLCKLTADEGDINVGELRLCKAAAEGNSALVNQLLQGGVNPDSADHNGTTALMRAALGGIGKLARLLIQHGADLNAVDQFKRTPLDWAFRCKDQHQASAMAHELVSRGAAVPLAARRPLQEKQHKRLQEIRQFLKRGEMPQEIGALTVEFIYGKKQ